MNRFFHLSVLVIVLACFLGGCVRRDDKPVFPKEDTAVLVDGEHGLNFKLLDWSWHNYPTNGTVKVQGSVVNQTGKTIQGCRMILDGFDEKGDSMGHAETFLQPTVIRPGAKAAFNFSFDSPNEIKNLHLKYSFAARSEGF